MRCGTVCARLTASPVKRRVPILTMLSGKDKSFVDTIRRDRLHDRFFNLPPHLKRPVLFLLIFLIVVVPVLFYHNANREVDEASAWVAHTATVEGKIYEVLYDLRDAEAASRTAAFLPGTPESQKAEADVVAALAAAPSNLDALQALTLDNPYQQERIGRLRASIEGRAPAMREMILLGRAGQVEAAKALLRQSIAANPFREVALKMIEEEKKLLAHRTEKAARDRRQVAFLIWGAAAAQLLLFFALYVVSEKDAARRRQAEEASLEAAAYAQSVVETNPDPLTVLDGAARIRSVNKAFAALYGVELGQVRGEPLWEVGGGAWRLPDLQQRLADLIPQGREIWDLEVAQQIGGERRVMLVNARPFPSASGEKLILLAAKDVTARKRIEEQITLLNQELAARVEQTNIVNQELEAFSYSVSHDLRAPLRHITGFADMLNTHLAKQEGDAKTERYLKYIRESANQMGTLIDDLLVFSRMGRSEMAEEEVNMAELVRDVIKHFNLETEGRRIEFAVGPIPSTRGDAAMLKLVWMNLIGNAIKYSRDADPARVEVGALPSDQPEHVYFVRDNGVGFNMKYVHKLFGVFQRLHQADEYEGTGIGLANVRRIVQRHGGKAWADGQVGQGATFSFSIPLQPHPTPDTPAPPLAWPRQPLT